MVPYLMATTGTARNFGLLAQPSPGGTLLPRQQRERCSPIETCADQIIHQLGSLHEHIDTPLHWEAQSNTILTLPGLLGLVTGW